MAKREGKRKQPPRVDSILPLPSGTGIPSLRQGEGKSIFKNENIIPGTEMTFRAFWSMWEQVELRAAQNYPRYVGGPMNYVAETWLEAVVWCRKMGNPDVHIWVMSEEKAKKARKWWEKEDKRLAEEEKAKSKKGKKGEGDSEPEEKPKHRKAKKRCVAEKKGVRCKGPIDHGGKHKGVTAKGKKVAWS